MRACGIRSASRRPCAIGTRSPRRCITMVGAEIAPRAGRTSIFNSAFIRPRAIPRGTSLVVDHQPTEPPHPLVHASQRRVCPTEVQMRHPAPGPHERRRPAAQHLVADAHAIGALRVASVRNSHRGTNLPQDQTHKSDASGDKQSHRCQEVLRLVPRREVLAGRGGGRYADDPLLAGSAGDRRQADGQGHALSVARIDFNRVRPRLLGSRTCATTTTSEAALSVSVAR